MRAQHFGCPVELTLSVLGGKWKVVLLARLKERPHRYAELRALTPALSDKVLTQRLQELVAAGLVVQDKQGQRGARSTYTLSPRGELLRPALDALYAWGLSEAEQRGIAFDSASR